MTESLQWKPDWALARKTFIEWWEHKGLALFVTAPKDQPWERIPPPATIADPAVWWRDIEHWTLSSIYQMSRTFWGGVAHPSFNTNIGGPGSLGLFLGAIGHPAASTLWYEPIIKDPDRSPHLRFRPAGEDWERHTRLLQLAHARNHGRYYVGYPDLIENIDTLAQLRDPQALLLDMLERPDWVKTKVREINQAFFASYDALGEWLRDPWGGTAWCAFAIWGPGKVAKVQCDFSCMISAEMFREFVVPSLSEQCAWLDYSMHHLDGTQAMHHLDALLEIEPLDAIEWTPQAGIEGGGHPRWYDLYRRIKAAGKSVQAIGVQPDEVEPLIDAVGPEGLYIMCSGQNETEARNLLRRVGWKGEA